MESLKHIYAGGSSRADELFAEQWLRNAQRTDHMFAALLIVEWLAAIVVALTVTPRAWNGADSSMHPHVWLALGLGAALTSVPVLLAWKCPGRAVTRHSIAVAQMLFSSLLIHITGGRIETHFHVFGSLAFLAFYRDWTVLIPATVIVALDHIIRGVFWPQSVFGVAVSEPWRWVEHAGWVVFEDIFLITACRYGVREMWESAERTAALEHVNSEMLRQTAELKAAYHTKHAIVENALDAVVGMGPDGSIIGWNSQAAGVFGWQADEVVGKQLAEIIVPERFREQHKAGLNRYLESGQGSLLNKRIEVSAIHRDGHEFPVELAIAPIQSNGPPTFCAFIRDITLRTEAAETLRNAKEMAEAASQAKSAFLANMSHEIRTPLNGILGFADLLLLQIDGDPEERRDYLQTIHSCGRHLLTVINDVLDISKIESGQIEVECIRSSPHEALAATVSILRARAQERGLNLEYFWKSEIPETIHIDPIRLRQILMNLVGNAIKFTEVGSVQVAARLHRDGPPKLIIDVMDTCVGIEAKSAERIFEPFVQADSSITRRFGGTGLGLSISRRLARLMGGDLTVSSDLGRGSVFSLTLPTGSLDGIALNQGNAADIIPARPSLEPEHNPGLSSCRVLVVDDGETNRKLIGVVLRQAGAYVECAENGRAGIAALSRGTFDLILMDMQMPVMDGYTATRELRRLGCELPIIALTAHAMADDERKCRDAGCSGYLTKPIDSTRLLAAVRDVARSTSVDAIHASGRREEGAPIDSSLPVEDPEFREVADAFVDQLEQRLESLRAACEATDLGRVTEIAHWIRGCGGTAGFDAFTEPAMKLERAAKKGLSGAIAHHVRELETLQKRIRKPVQH